VTEGASLISKKVEAEVAGGILWQTFGAVKQLKNLRGKSMIYWHFRGSNFRYWLTRLQNTAKMGHSSLKRSERPGKEN